MRTYVRRSGRRTFRVMVSPGQGEPYREGSEYKCKDVADRVARAIESGKLLDPNWDQYRVR